MKTIKATDLPCPRCGARPGRPCTSERIPSVNTLGGGWGGYMPTKKPHTERYQARREALGAQVRAEVAALHQVQS